MKRLAAGLITVFLMASPAGAEPGPIGKWLMAQPLTLWDIGMIRATDSAKWASDLVKSETESEIGKGPLAGPFAGASYDWNNNEIDIYLSILDYRGEMTHEKCNELRGLFLDGLGRYIRALGEDKWRNGILSQIYKWFSHRGFKSDSRDEDLAEKMSRIIFVQVEMRNRFKTGISCRDRILTLDAPSKPFSVRAADQSSR